MQFLEKKYRYSIFNFVTGRLGDCKESFGAFEGIFWRIKRFNCSIMKNLREVWDHRNTQPFVPLH
jgi:hypothetical protein